MPRPKQSLTANCKKCTLTLRNPVICIDCESSYHPTCLLSLPGVFVDVSGRMHCCSGGAFDCVSCSRKDDEIVQLRGRLSLINEKNLDSSLVEITMTQEADSQLGEALRCLELFRVELLARFSRLQSDFSELKDIAHDVHAKISTVPEPCCEDLAHRVRSAADEINGLDNGFAASSTVGMPRRPRVLILADEHGRDCSSVLRGLLGGHYDVSGCVKPGAGMDGVTCGVAELVRDYGKCDFVVVMAGTNDIAARYRWCSNIVKKLLSATV